MTDKTPAQAFDQFDAARTDWADGRRLVAPPAAAPQPGKHPAWMCEFADMAASMKARRAAAKPAPVAPEQDLRERTIAQVRAELASARAQLDPSYVFSDDGEHFRRHDQIAGRIAALADELERLQ
jgi:hypothetical protein